MTIKFAYFCSFFIFLFSFNSSFGQTTFSSNLKFLTASEAPANYISNGKVKGISVDIVNAVIDDLGLSSKIRLLPWARAFQTGKTTPNIVLFTAGKTKEREDLGFRFIGPIVSRNHAIMQLTTSQQRIDSLEQLKHSKLALGGILGDWRTIYLENQNITIDSTAKTMLHNFRKLKNRRLDFVIASDLELLGLKVQAGNEIPDVSFAYIFTNAPSYMMISSGTSDETYKALSNSFEKLQRNGTLIEIADKWSVILDSQMIFTKGKGIHLDILD